jgi:hypothetical protein
VGVVPVGVVPGVVPVGVVPLSGAPAAVVPVGAVPPAPVWVCVGVAVSVVLRTRFGLEVRCLGVFRAVRFALCIATAEGAPTAIRSLLLADDGCGEEGVARCSETTRAEAWVRGAWVRPVSARWVATTGGPEPMPSPTAASAIAAERPATAKTTRVDVRRGFRRPSSGRGSE